ncbi:MAG TPA: Na+/H+ antiporter [Candidatus Limnocylindrales bacterium]|nr:Na+/H+ antiporter [Candidatus Limnocylindrales bacterium]
MSDISLVVLLIGTVIVLTGISRKLSLSTPIVMVVGGLLLSFVPQMPSVELSPDLVFLGFLPPLLWAGGFFTSRREFKANLRAIILLAFGLVLFTAATVAFVAHELIPAIGWAGAFALGGIVAPPDAVAATAIFQRLGVPRRIVAILEGESLVNDATALVIYRFAVVAAAVGSFSLLDATGLFVFALFGGVVIGLALGFVLDWLAQRVKDTALIVAIIFIAPYIAYLPAEAMGVSGVIAVVVAGAYTQRAIRHTSSDARVVGESVWKIWLFVLNGLVFFLLGFQLRTVIRQVDLTPATITATVAIVLAVVLSRFVWAFPGTYVPRLIPHIRDTERRPPIRAVIVVSWSGLRGVVSLAAALALPVGFPARDLILFITFTVILVTLVGQGLTLPLVIRALGLAPDQDVAHSEAHARALTSEAALDRIDELAEVHPDHKELIDALRSQYEYRTRHAEAHHGDEPGAAEKEELEHAEIRRQLIDAERLAASELHERGVIDDEILRRIERDLDLEELRMEA